MDTSHQNQSPKFCKKHNQSIIWFDKLQNQDLCFTCVQDRTGMVPIDQIQKEKQEIKLQSDKEFQLEQQQLQQLLDSILNHKQNIIVGIDKIIQIIIDQINNIKSTKERFLKQIEQGNQIKTLEQLKIQLKQQRVNHQQIKTQVNQLLSDFQQKYMNIDYLNKILAESSYKIDENDIIASKSKNIKITEIIQNPRVYQYELIKESGIKEREECLSFTFNKDYSILIIGCYSKIKIYQFINGKIGKCLQDLQDHESFVYCLHFMQKSNCFVSGSWDKSIIIWKQESNNQWVTQQILKYHQHYIHCLSMNKNEDLLISGGADQTVRFWKKINDQWTCQQTIEIDDIVFALSLNKIENKLITCGYGEFVYVIEFQGYKYWSIKQKIKVDQCGYRLCFTLGNQFVFQLYKKNYLEVYNYDSNSKLFMKQSQVQIQSCQISDTLFPCQFVRGLNILFVKNGQFLNIFQVKENQNYKLIQTIQFNDNQFFGTVSNDGQYLVTWDKGSKEILVRKLN